MAFTLVTVTGTFLITDDLSPARGEVIFRLSHPMQDTGNNQVVSADRRSVRLDANGSFSITLPANDDPTTQPTGTFYEVEEIIEDSPRRSYSIILSNVNTSVDLADLAPTIPGPQQFQYALAGHTHGAGTLALDDLTDVFAPAPTDLYVLSWVAANNRYELVLPTILGAPATADYLTGTAQAGLAAEIVVGTTPQGELGGTWGSPTVDASHSGSTHASVLASAVAADAAHVAAGDPHAGYVLESLLDAKGDLYVASADNTPGRLAIGADTFVLTADSAQPLGVKWAAAAAGYTDEQVDDRVAVLIQNGTGISWVYSDPSGTLTPTITLAPFTTTNLAEGSNLYFTDERAQDAIGTAASDTASVNVTYNDAGNLLTFDVLPAGVDHNALANLTVGDVHTQYQKESEKGVASGYASLGADVLVPQDQLGTGVQDGTKFLRDDGTWQSVPSGYTDEQAQDAVGTILLDTATIDLTYVDATPSISADVKTASITAAMLAFDPATQAELDAHVAAADPHVGYVLESLLDAKGDIYAASADNTPARLAVGTNGQVLTAQSAQTTGLLWATLTTTNIAEGTNLYYTDERVDDRVATLFVDGTGIDSVYNDAGNTFTVTVDLSELSTTTLPEGTNLYYTAERAQDDVAAALVDSSSIDFTYVDATPSISAAVLPAGVDHNALANLATGDVHTQYLLESVLTTKGDIYVATGASTVVRQSVGSNGQVLTADSTVTNGIKWAAAPAGTPASTVTDETTLGIAPAVGADTEYARQSHTHGSLSVATFNEAAQDAIGAMLLDSSSIDFTYVDATPSLTAVVLPAGVDHNSLANIATGDPHTQYALLANAVMDGDTAGGSFAGTYPNPNLGTGVVSAGNIAANAITNVKVDAAAAIAFSKLASPIAAFSMNSQAITNLADPVATFDAATKNYVDTRAATLRARMASTGNLTLSGTQTIDGVLGLSGDRVLAKNQTTGSENGLYQMVAGAWSRSPEANVDSEVVGGLHVWVNEGTVNGDTEWVITTDDPIVLNTTAITFTRTSFDDERAQDAVGTIFVDTASIDFTYTDATPSITAAVLPAGVDHNALANITTGDPHTQYVLESLVDAKGDIVTATANDTPARLAVGADDTMLMADTAQATGLKWVAPATPGNSAPGDVAAAGTSDDFARGSHVHGRVAEGAAWASFSPSFTGLTIGNGTVVAKFIQIGKTVRGRLAITFGSTTSISAVIDFAPPASPTAAYAVAQAIGTGTCLDNSASTVYPAVIVVLNTTTLRVYVVNAASTIAQYTAPDANVPFTWAVNDVVSVSFEYEAA